MMAKDKGFWDVTGEVVSLPFIVLVVIVELAVRLVFLLPVWFYLLLSDKNPFKGADEFVSDLPVTKALMELFS